MTVVPSELACPPSLNLLVWTVLSSCNILNFSFKLFVSSPHIFLAVFSWFCKISADALHLYKTM